MRDLIQSWLYLAIFVAMLPYKVRMAPFTLAFHKVLDTNLSYPSSATHSKSGYLFGFPAKWRCERQKPTGERHRAEDIWPGRILVRGERNEVSARSGQWDPGEIRMWLCGKRGSHARRLHSNTTNDLLEMVRLRHTAQRNAGSDLREDSLQQSTAIWGQINRS